MATLQGKCGTGGMKCGRMLEDRNRGQEEDEKDGK